MTELYGMPYLKNKLSQKRPRILQRYKYYDMKAYTKDFGISTPPNLRNAMGVLGWSGNAVDNLANRLQIYRFNPDSDVLNMQDIYDLNNPDALYDSAILSALIGSCSFLYVYKDGEDVKIDVIDASEATGVIDTKTGLLTEGYAVLERSKDKNPILEAYFYPGGVDYYSYGKYLETATNALDYCTLVPVIYRPSAMRPFGHSRITRAMMYLQQVATRTLMRSEVSAEFYSYPQKWAVGTDPDMEALDSWKASMSSMLQFTKGKDGDKPTVGQFSQASMEPHLSQLEMVAGMYAGECGLTLEDLGFFKENPSSEETIKAAHENLRLTARKAQKSFSSAFINAGYIAASLRDNGQYKRSEAVKTKIEWEPIFEPDMSSLSSMGDAIYKINQVIPNYFNDENMHQLTGMKSNIDK